MNEPSLIWCVNFALSHIILVVFFASGICVNVVKLFVKQEVVFTNTADDGAL